MVCSGNTLVFTVYVITISHIPKKCLLLCNFSLQVCNNYFRNTFAVFMSYVKTHPV